MNKFIILQQKVNQPCCSLFLLFRVLVSGWEIVGQKTDCCSQDLKPFSSNHHPHLNSTSGFCSSLTRNRSHRRWPLRSNHSHSWFSSSSSAWWYDLCHGDFSSHTHCFWCWLWWCTACFGPLVGLRTAHRLTTCAIARSDCSTGGVLSKFAISCWLMICRH